MMPMPASASCAPSACEVSGPLKRMEATAPAVGRTHSKRSAWRVMKAWIRGRVRVRARVRVGVRVGVGVRVVVRVIVGDEVL